MLSETKAPVFMRCSAWMPMSRDKLAGVILEDLTEREAHPAVFDCAHSREADRQS
jgi:hypothetical protein